MVSTFGEETSLYIGSVEEKLVPKLKSCIHLLMGKPVTIRIGQRKQTIHIVINNKKKIKTHRNVEKNASESKMNIDMTSPQKQEVIEWEFEKAPETLDKNAIKMLKKERRQAKVNARKTLTPNLD